MVFLGSTAHTKGLEAHRLSVPYLGISGDSLDTISRPFHWNPLVITGASSLAPLPFSWDTFDDSQEVEQLSSEISKPPSLLFTVSFFFHSSDPMAVKVGQNRRNREHSWG